MIQRSSFHKVFETSCGTFLAHEVNDVLGRGTYGVVYRVFKEDDSKVTRAIKVFSPETMDEAEGIPSTTLREINVLKTINHPNIMTASEVVIPDSKSPNDMFFVMELCQGTLKDKIIQSINKHLRCNSLYINPSANEKLPTEYVTEMKVLAWQLLNSLAVLHSRGIMHRDLKPVNILWSFDDQLKVADFGLSRFVRGNQNSENSIAQQTGEVQTMWYRAPEVLLGDEKYGLLVDDWSVGCVIAELFRFRINSSGRMEPAPLFQGRSDIGTLMIIFETLGTPLQQNTSSYLHKLRYWNVNYPQWTKSRLRERIPLLDETGHKLLEKLLCLSPAERVAARFLLNHPWFNDVKHLLTGFVPWYHGFESDYQRMMAVDRLPLPKTIKEAAAAQQKVQLKDEEKKNVSESVTEEPSNQNLYSKTQNQLDKTKIIRNIFGGKTEETNFSSYSSKVLTKDNISDTVTEDNSQQTKGNIDPFKKTFFSTTAAAAASTKINPTNSNPNSNSRSQFMRPRVLSRTRKKTISKQNTSNSQTTLPTTYYDNQKTSSSQSQEERQSENENLITQHPELKRLRPRTRSVTAAASRSRILK